MFEDLELTKFRKSEKIGCNTTISWCISIFCPGFIFRKYHAAYIY